MELPEWSGVLKQKDLRDLCDFLRWMRCRQLHTMDIQGAIVTGGEITISGYIQVDPSSYPGYQGYGQRYGIFSLAFPAVLSGLRTLRLQCQYGSNAALLATVSSESKDGVLVTVCDAGGTPITGTFGLWVEASGPAAAGILPSHSLTPNWWPPHAEHPLNAWHLNRVGQSIAYQHGAVPYYRNTNGSVWSSANGIGEIVGYKLIDPGSYPGYVGTGNNYGAYHISLPSGIFSSLIGLAVQPASGANGAIIAAVSNAGPTGFDVFVWDSGGTPIEVHALWIRARGILSSGVLPFVPADRNFSLPSVDASTHLTSSLFQNYSDCCHYRLRRTAFLFDLNGNMLSHGYGYGVVEGYVFVDPYSYGPGYAGAGARYGIYPIVFPDGVFEDLLYVGLQPASSANTWMTASISNEKPGGCTVFVWDVGGSVIQGHAQWVTAIGLLKAGVLP